MDLCPQLVIRIQQMMETKTESAAILAWLSSACIVLPAPTSLVMVVSVFASMQAASRAATKSLSSCTVPPCLPLAAKAWNISF